MFQASAGPNELLVIPKRPQMKWGAVSQMQSRLCKKYQKISLQTQCLIFAIRMIRDISRESHHTPIVFQSRVKRLFQRIVWGHGDHSTFSDQALWDGITGVGRGSEEKSVKRIHVAMDLETRTFLRNRHANDSNHEYPWNKLQTCHIKDSWISWNQGFCRMLLGTLNQYRILELHHACSVQPQISKLLMNAMSCNECLNLISRTAVLWILAISKALIKA